MKRKPMSMRAFGRTPAGSPADEAPKPKRSKYGNVKTDGFDSKKEALRHAELLLLEQAGEIRNLRTQVKYLLIPACPPERATNYVADFVYEALLYAPGHDSYKDKTWIDRVEDVKSPATRKKEGYIIKRKLMNWRYNIRILET